MKRISDKYLALYLEQLESLRKSNPWYWMHQEPWRLALEEIRDRRAADLAAEDVEGLRWALRNLRAEIAADGEEFPGWALRAREASAALSKLIDGGKS